MVSIYICGTKYYGLITLLDTDSDTDLIKTPNPTAKLYYGENPHIAQSTDSDPYFL